MKNHAAPQANDTAKPDQPVIPRSVKNLPVHSGKLALGNTIQTMIIGDEIRQDYKVRAYHEAGHAVVNASMELRFRSVGLGGVDFGKEDNTKCSEEQLIKFAKGTAAGLLATSRYDTLHPDAPLSHIAREGEQDEQMLQEVAICLERTPPEETIAAWKGEVAALLKIPAVWSAVEELAGQLEETQGRSRIPEERIRAVLHDAKNR